MGRQRAPSGPPESEGTCLSVAAGSFYGLAEPQAWVWTAPHVGAGPQSHQRGLHPWLALPSHLDPSFPSGGEAVTEGEGGKGLRCSLGMAEGG